LLLYHRNDARRSILVARAMIFTPPPDEPWTIRARWVFPADAPPIADGRLTVHGTRILRVAADGRADFDAGNAAILPGFVNAHTHLDLGMLHGGCPPTPDLPAWLRCVIAGRMAASPDQVQQAIADGIAACLRSGTTLVGDISAGAASWALLSQAPLRSVVFYELLGLPRDRADRTWRAAQDWLRGAHATERCRPGLSPHAPYSVRRDLFIRAAEWCRAFGLPLATHLAETQAELQLLREHAGPFADFLRELNVWDPGGLVAGPEEVLALSREAPAVLFAHGNYLPADTAMAAGQAVVYCPRTHAAFGHAPHPLLHRGMRVALGTDSLASNPDLGTLAEARFMHARHPDIGGERLLRMLTLDGATALGWGDVTGSLSVRKFADFVVLPLQDAEANDPHALVWESERAVTAVIIGGAWALPPAM
jgi:cytosine/adenosine deaminase-related metal-dependent hydrolase